MQKRFKIILSIILVLALFIVTQYWETTFIERESHSINQTITLMLSGYKNNDPEQVYAQLVPVEYGGSTTLNEIRGALAGPDVELEVYRSIQIEMLWVYPLRNLLRASKKVADARVILSYENGCQIPFSFELAEINEEWKISDLYFEDMSLSEVRDCIERK